MSTIKTAAAIASLVAAPLAQAATDPGLTLHGTHAYARHLGVGAQARIVVPLSGARKGGANAGPTLSLRAGPTLSRSGVTVASRQRNLVAPLGELAVVEGRSTTWSLAGQPLAASYSSAALREQAGQAPEGPHNNISTIGIVAIGVGVAAIVGGLLFIDAVNDASD